MVDRELTEREDARLSTRLKAARLRQSGPGRYRLPNKLLILQLGSG